jgi:hypothetical protein
MPQNIPNNAIETPFRRQITSVNFSVDLDTADTPAPIPRLTATVGFTDIWKTAEGLPVAYPVANRVVLTHDELINCHPAALQVLGAVELLAYQRAGEQGV